MTSENNVDVIVVGAGISGLTAAFNIKKRDPSARIVILEGKDRVGGRTLTVPLVSSKGTDHWDLGGQWVGRSQVHIIKLLQELGLKTYPQFIQGTKFQQLGETEVRTYTSEIPNLSLWALLDLYWFMTKLDRFQAELDVEDPYSHPRAAEWDALSVAAYMDRTLYTRERLVYLMDGVNNWLDKLMTPSFNKGLQKLVPQYKCLNLGAQAASEAAVRSIFGCETSQISFLYYLLYVHMAGGLKNLIEATESTAQESKIQGGAQQISQILAENVGKDAVHTGDPVTSVQQTEHEVTVTTAKGWTARASYVILAMPPKAIERITFLPRLPEDRVDFMKHMPMGNMTKVIITYEKAFWRVKNLSGQIVSDGGEVTVPGCSLGPLSITYDATSTNGCPALVGFLGGDAAVNWARQTASVRQKAVLDHLSVFFGPEVYSFLDYAEKNWNDEPCSWGAPVSYVTPGGVENFARAIRRPYGRLHFAGTEAATFWSGYMSGAVQAGERTAIEVLFRLNPSVLSEADISVSRQAMAQYEGSNFTARLRTKKGGCKGMISSLFFFSVGVGLVTTTVYLVTRCVTKKEIGISWLKSVA